jgi:hypothetical protein
VLKVSLNYDRGTVIIKGLAHVPFATIDPRTNSLRAQALDYSNIVSYLRESAIICNDFVLDLCTFSSLGGNQYFIKRLST